MNKAVDIAISQNYLDGFFKRHKEGVVDMSLTEYNEAEFIENRREEGREEGRKEGILNERARAIVKMRKRGDSYEEIADFYEISEAEVKKIEASACQLV